MRIQRRSGRKMGALLAATALTLTAAACGGGSGSGSDSGGPVTIWLSLDQSVADGLEKQLEAKAKDAGVEIKVERVDSIDKLLKTKIQAGDTPDIALVPQPGVVASVVELGAAFPLDDVVDTAALGDAMVPGALEAGTVDDKLYGLLVSMNVKSLILYPKKAFEEAGYQAPESLDDLTALADQIKSDGGTPWCLTMGSGDATGWVATDWIEDLVMRYGGVDGYKAWVSHDAPFDSDYVKEAAAYFEGVALTEGNVLGGSKAITATDFAEAAKPMFDAKGPGCWMTKQGSFFVGPDFLPEDVYANVDEELGVMAFPPAEAGGENPVLGGGDLAILMNDSADAKTVMGLMAESDLGTEAAPTSSFISPFKDFDTSLYPTETTRTIAKVAYDSSAFLFDGSDSMPAEVGAGSFWKEMTAWLNGDEDVNQALSNIEASWPAS